MRATKRDSLLPPLAYHSIQHYQNMDDNNSPSTPSLDASTTHTNASLSGTNLLSHGAAATSIIFAPIAAPVL